MAKRALVSEFTPVRGRSRTARIHAFPYGASDGVVCGRLVKNWIIVPALSGISKLDMLTCSRCKGGCR